MSLQQGPLGNPPPEDSEPSTHILGVGGRERRETGVGHGLERKGENGVYDYWCVYDGV